MIIVSSLQMSELMEQATRLLTHTFETQLELSAPEVLKDWERNLLVRCQINTNVSSVIIKQIKGNKTCGFSDWASLQFISSLDGVSDIAPQIYAGDMENSFFVMEDLGVAKTLDDVLRGTDMSLAEQYFLDLIKRTASLHLKSISREKEYLEIRHAFPADSEHGRLCEARRWHEGIEKVRTWFALAGCPVPDCLENSMDSCLSSLNEVYINPGQFLTFTHGDMAPSNNHVGSDRVYLLDFEYGDYRHALYDITAWYMLCPLPEWLAAKLKELYKEELLSKTQIIGDVFDRHWNYLCAWRGLALLSWIPHTILEENRPWVGEWTMREAFLCTLHRLGKVCSNSEELTPLRTSLATLSHKLEELWCQSLEDTYKQNVTEETIDLLIPKWPAFQANR